MTELRKALDWFVQHRDALETEVRAAHSGRGAAASGWMREDDADFRRDLREAFDRLEAALASQSPPPTDDVRAEMIAWLLDKAAEQDEDWAADNQPVEQGGPGSSGGPMPRNFYYETARTLSAQLPPQTDDEDALVLAMLNQLHSHLPEAERPMSISDLSDDQAERARRAVRRLHPSQLPPPIRGEVLGQRLQAHYEMLRTWAIPLHVLRDIEAAAEALATSSSSKENKS